MKCPPARPQPPRHGDPLAGNVPVQLTRLVGRDSALAELRSLVWRTRVLTLAGPGGAGKTRLGMALADAMRPDFIGGAWWVDLSTTLESELVAQVVAASVLDGELSGDPTPATLARQLPESMLLALDNCEQVVGGCAELIVALLGRSPSLRVIATSRQPLGVPGEQVWRVPGLATGDTAEPGVRRPDDPDDGAVALFMQRAGEASTAFDPDAPGVRENVRRICEWLDGMPLAIELAAARVPVLSVTQIAQRLEVDPSLLRHTARTAAERHRTMDGMLEWSHRMLEPDEQRLFRRLSVFRGSFSLAAAESVCAGYLLELTEVLDLLAVLIDRSLVQVVDHPEEPRYRLLATVRQYAAAKLWDGPEGPTVHSRHAHYFLGLALAARDGLAGPDQPGWIERLELEHDNLEAALHWLSEESIDDGRAARPAAVAVLVPARLLPRGPKPLRAPACPGGRDLPCPPRPRPGQRGRGRLPPMRLRDRRGASQRRPGSRSASSAISAPSRPRFSDSVRSPASRAATTRPATCTSAAWRSGGSSEMRPASPPRMTTSGSSPG